MQINQQCEDHLGRQVIYYTLEQGVQNRLLCIECIQERNIYNYHNIEELPQWIQSNNQQTHQLITIIDTSFKEIQYKQQLILELVKQRFNIDISKLSQYTYFQLSNLINVLNKIHECLGQFQATVNFVTWKNELQLFKSNFLDPNFSSYNKLNYQQNLNTKFEQEIQDLQKTNTELISKVVEREQKIIELNELLQNHKSLVQQLFDRVQAIQADNQQNQFFITLVQTQLMEKDQQIQQLSREKDKIQNEIFNLQQEIPRPNPIRNVNVCGRRIVPQRK